MNRRWRFDDLEFVALWNERNGDVLPPPLLFTSRTPRLVDYERELAEARQRLAIAADSVLHGVLDAVGRPDVRIVVNGIDDRNPERPGSHIRLLAILCRGHGYLMKQEMGETIWHSAGFTVTECAPQGLADAVVAELPETGAGRLGDIRLIESLSGHDGMDYSYGRPPWRGSFDDTVEEQSHQFHTASSASAGMVEVIQGRSRFGPRGISRHLLHWKDIDNDGRYVVASEHRQVAVAADSKRCAAMINTGIAMVVKALEDDYV